MRAALRRKLQQACDLLTMLSPPFSVAAESVPTTGQTSSKAVLQAKYADLTPESAAVAKQGEPLPSLEQLEGLLRRAKQVTLRDVWGLMLCAVPRECPPSANGVATFDGVRDWKK